MNLNIETQSADAVWGNESCWLEMPGYKAEFRGLSLNQKEMLAQHFDDFLLAESDVVRVGGQVLVCDVYQLDRELDIDQAELDDNGQYSPIQIRENESVKVFGHNFVARFTIGQSNTSVASIGVFNEGDFAHMMTIENFLRLYTAHYAVGRNGAILHSAGIVVGQQAIVFAGYSNVGKTTLTSKAYASGYGVLSDDINLLLPAEIDGYEAFKVPFTGEFGRSVEQRSMNKSYPLKLLAMLEQADRVDAQVMPPAAAISRLLTASPFVNKDEYQIPALFDIYANLVERVPIVKLSLTKDCKFNDILAAIDTLELVH